MTSTPNLSSRRVLHFGGGGRGPAGTDCCVAGAAVLRADAGSGDERRAQLVAWPALRRGRTPAQGPGPAYTRDTLCLPCLEAICRTAQS